MSIQSQIERINNAKAGIAEAISEKGVSVPSGTSIDEMPTLVRSIPQEGVSSGDTLTVECVFDLSTMTVLNFSRTYDEIISALQEGKVIFFKSNYGIGYAFGQLVAQLVIDNILMFQLMIQADLGAGKTLYYFNIALFADNRTVVQPYIINTTALGG